jgi:hypothetical protein
MAYANKYKITYATKADKKVYLYLLEDGYSGTVYEYMGVDISLEYLPQSDDPFEPLLTSQLNVSIDITEYYNGTSWVSDLSVMPNFVTLDDRKYFAKLYIDTDLEWTGWAISDNVQVSFSTGRKMLYFNCVDGLGMLENINLPIADTVNTNTSNTALYYLRTSLNSANLPTTPNIITSCNFYGTGMTDRGTSATADPFAQAYLPYRTFLNTDGTYLSCLDVIKNIAKSFGCRVFMSGGKWWIVSINTFSNTTINFTEYTYSGSVVTTPATLNRLSTIQSYNGNTSGVYFIDNSQIKLLKKGFAKIFYNKDVKTANNYLTNGNLRPLQSGSTLQPQNWNVSWTGLGSASYVSNANENTAVISLNRGTSASATLQTMPVSGGNPAAGPYIGASSKLKLSWTYFGQSLTGYRGNVYLSVSAGSSYYVWDGTKWSSTTGDYYSIPAYTGTSGSQINSFSFETDVVPIAGQIAFAISVETGTCEFIQVGDFKLEVIPLLNKVNYTIYQNSTSQYAKEIEIPYGVYSASATYPVELGVFQNSSGAAFGTWYQYGKSGTYASLIELLMQQYMNVLGDNIINLDCTISSFNTANGYVNASKMLKATDTDPSQINVSSNSYMLGNSTINYVNNNISSTLLKISDTTKTATNKYELFYNTLI